MSDRVWGKYRLVLTGIDIFEMGHERTKRVVEAWAQESGMMNVKNHHIEADADMCQDVLIYTIAIDSAGWTGISSS